jgi:hypothetical protein
VISKSNKIERKTAVNAKSAKSGPNVQIVYNARSARNMQNVHNARSAPSGHSAVASGPGDAMIAVASEVGVDAGAVGVDATIAANNNRRVNAKPIVSVNLFATEKRVVSATNRASMNLVDMNQHLRSTLKARFKSLRQNRFVISRRKRPQ